MNCLDKYRSKLVASVNRNLRIIRAAPEPEAAHEFRVGIKRLTAFYNFLAELHADMDAKTILRPYRALFKSIGQVRDGHIAVLLLQELDAHDTAPGRKMIAALNSMINRDYRQFQKIAQARSVARMPSLRSTEISESAILRHKPVAQNFLLERILEQDSRMNARRWHKKRILLKRYQHNLDAFCYCPGHLADEEELKKIKVLTQLLGDWHDRVIVGDLLQSLPGFDARIKPLVDLMNQQDKHLLGSAKIYLNQFRRWHQGP